jgi:hypothetical protein
MHVLAVCVAICAGLYVVIRLTMRLFFPPDS